MLRDRARAHARQQNAEYCGCEAQRIRVVRKVNESNEHKGAAVSHVTKQHQAVHQPDAAQDGVSEGVDIRGG